VKHCGFDFQRARSGTALRRLREPCGVLTSASGPR
jgi:hypothetical protein